MENPKTYSELEADRLFAIKFNGSTWGLLEKPDRTSLENELLIDYAHASLAHWRVAGTPLHLQRGSWLLSRVYNVLGRVDSSLFYADRCQELTLQHKDLMQDFDLAYAFEAQARAYALAGNRIEAEKFLIQARQVGDLIQNDEDRKIFQGDLNSGTWHGLK